MTNASGSAPPASPSSLRFKQNVLSSTLTSGPPTSGGQASQLAPIGLDARKFLRLALLLGRKVPLWAYSYDVSYDVPRPPDAHQSEHTDGHHHGVPGGDGPGPDHPPPTHTTRHGQGERKGVWPHNKRLYF
jgi:hypothetical protein